MRTTGSICGAAILATLLLSACRDTSKPARPEFHRDQVALRIGVAGVLDVSAWTTVEIDARNTGADFAGVVEVTGGRGHRGTFSPGPVTHRLDGVEIASGSTRRLRIPARASDWTAVRVVFRQPGFERSLVFDEFPVSPVLFRALLVTDGTRDHGALSRWLGDTWLEPLSRARTRTITNLSAETVPLVDLVAVVGASPEEMPAVAATLDQFDLVVLDGVTFAGASDRVTALRGWVESGGVIAAFPGPRWGAGLSRPFRDLLSMRTGDPSATAPARVLTALSERARDGATYREIHPEPGAWTAGGGLAVVADRGLGRTVTFSIAPGGASFPGREDAPGVYDLLDGLAARALNHVGLPRRTASLLEPFAPQILHDMSGLRVPGAPAVALGLFVYLALGFVVPALLFLRSRRREWAFAVVVGAAILATGAIYGLGALSALDERSLHELTVLGVHADDHTAEATSFVAVASPSIDRVTVADRDAPGMSAALIDPVRGSYFGPYHGAEEIRVPAVTVDVSPDGRMRLPDVALFPNAHRFFRHEWRTTLDGLVAFEEETLRDGTPVSLRARNLSGRVMEAFLLRGADVADLGPFRPGAELRVSDIEEQPARVVQADVPWSFHGGPGVGPGYTRMLVEKALAHPQELPWWMGAERFTSGNVAPMAHRGVRQLQERRTGVLVLIVQDAVFPASDDFEKRGGLTIIIRELDLNGGKTR